MANTFEEYTYSDLLGKITFRDHPAKEPQALHPKVVAGHLNAKYKSLKTLLRENRKLRKKAGLPLDKVAV